MVLEETHTFPQILVGLEQFISQLIVREPFIQTSVNTQNQVLTKPGHSQTLTWIKMCSQGPKTTGIQAS